MVKLNINNIKISFFVSLMILSTRALQINLLNILTDFKCKTYIKSNVIADGNKVYAGTSLRPIYYRTCNETSTVIAYIVDETRFEEIAHSNALNARTVIANELGKNHHEMIVLGIENCQNDEFNLIGAFLFDIIEPHPCQVVFSILTMGEQTFNQTYRHHGHAFEKYEENPNIFYGAFQQYLNGRYFPKMEYRAKRPDATSNIKIVKLFENLDGRRRYYRNVSTWPVSVKNGEYIPVAAFNSKRSEYNFVKRYKDKKFHLLILSGKEYNRLTSVELPWIAKMKKIMDKMIANSELLLIMGCFNFDWSEVDIVRQIILVHSEISVLQSYNVFTVGVGMFNTYFRNTDSTDPRCLRPSLNNRVIKFINEFDRTALKKKTLHIYDFLNALSGTTTIPIHLSNGRYIPVNEFKDYCFTNQHPNAKFAFIVMNSTEMHDQNVFSVAHVNQYVELLKSNDIVVFVIKAYNFELFDLHIIPKWIERHRGAVHRDRIAILGGGSFDTAFKYVSPEWEVTYTLLNVANELKEIRKAFVDTAGDKSVIVANIDTSIFESRRFPMHTINGYYDPVILSTNDMFHTENGTKILFLIMNADKFNKMAIAFPTWEPTLMTNLRQKIASHYPVQQWAVYLVGLNNFGETDFHLFAEFVKIHTNDARPLHEFVYTFGDDIYQAAYAYRDTLPFATFSVMLMADAFIEFFGMVGIISQVMD